MSLLKGNEGWDQETEQCMINSICLQFSNDWIGISKAILFQTGKQFDPSECKKRYEEYLARLNTSSSWCAEEEETLFRLQSELGNKWRIIAMKLGGR